MDLEKLISTAISIQSQRRGWENFILTDPDQSLVENPVSVASEATDAEILFIAKAKDIGKAIDLDLVFFDISQNKPIAELRCECAKDMLLDNAIFAAVDEVLNKAQNLGYAAPEQTPVEKTPEDSSPKVSQEFVPAPALEEVLVRQPGGFKFDLSIGPFLAAGSMAEFFGPAGGLELRPGWLFSLPNYDLDLGLNLGCILCSAQGPLQSAFGILVPLALDLRVAVPVGVFRPFAYLTLGTEFFYIQTPLYGGLYTFLPYGNAGIGISWVFRSKLSFLVKFSYSLAVDGKDLIQAFMPTIGLSIPFGGRYED